MELATLLNIPRDILWEIFSFLHIRDLKLIICLCKHFRDSSKIFQFLTIKHKLYGLGLNEKKRHLIRSYWPQKLVKCSGLTYPKSYSYSNQLKFKYPFSLERTCFKFEIRTEEFCTTGIFEGSSYKFNFQIGLNYIFYQDGTIIRSVYEIKDLHFEKSNTYIIECKCNFVDNTFHFYINGVLIKSRTYVFKKVKPELVVFFDKGTFFRIMN